MGTYNVVMTGKASYKFDNKTLESQVRAQQNNVSVGENATTNSITLLPEVYNTSEGFVISEVFFTQMLQLRANLIFMASMLSSLTTPITHFMQIAWYSFKVQTSVV